MHRLPGPLPPAPDRAPGPAPPIVPEPARGPDDAARERGVSIAEYLARTTAEMEERLQQHRVLLQALLEEEGSGAAEAARRPSCLYLDCPRQRRLRHALVDVIEVLEETRRSFKSRQLEALRRRVVAALVDA